MPQTASTPRDTNADFPCGWRTSGGTEAAGVDRKSASQELEMRPAVQEGRTTKANSSLSLAPSLSYTLYDNLRTLVVIRVAHGAFKIFYSLP